MVCSQVTKTAIAWNYVPLLHLTLQLQSLCPPCLQQSETAALKLNFESSS